MRIACVARPPDSPPDPRTGATTLRLDPLELIHRLTLQIPDPKQHLVRYSGACANRVRRLYRAAEGMKRGSGGMCPATGPRGPPGPRDEESTFAKDRKKTWARLLRKVFEVDPLLCPACKVEMTVVSVITDSVVVDAILEHTAQGGGHDPHAPRAPPAA